MKTLLEIINILQENNNKLEFKQSDFPCGFSIALVSYDEKSSLVVKEFDEEGRIELLRMELTETDGVISCTSAYKHLNQMSVEGALAELNDYIDQFDV